MDYSDIHWNARGVDNQDIRIREAINRIYRQFGHKVSVEKKGKDLLKFGRTANADAGVRTTVAQFQAVSVVNETFTTTNSIDRIVASDTGPDQLIGIEGHTIDASGNLTFVVQEATLSGETPVALTTPLARCVRLYLKGTGSFAAPQKDLDDANIYVFSNAEASGVTNGVPNTATATKAMIEAGFNQTQKCATAISQSDYWIITNVAVGLRKGNSNTVTCDAEIEKRDITDGGVFRPFGLSTTIRASGTSQTEMEFNPCLIVPPNHDVRMIAISNAANVEVQGFIHGHLATVVD